MKALLHVGPHKTGTTSLQNFLHLNGERLACHQIYVPKIPSPDGSANHWYLVYVASRDGEQASRYHNSQRSGHTPDECLLLRRKYRALLDNALRNAKRLDDQRGGKGMFTLSSEEVGFLENDEMNSLYKILLRYCESLEVIYYYRSPLERLRSDLQQASKGGKVHSVEQLRNLPCQDTLRLNRLLPTAELQPKVRIGVRAYRRGLVGFETWDIREDYCELLGLDPSQLQIPAQDPGANQSMSLQMFCILQDINRMMPTFGPDAKFNEFKRHFHTAVENYNWTKEDTPFRFSRGDVELLLASQEKFEGFLTICERHPSVSIDPLCRSVFARTGEEPVETGALGSIFDYVPPISHGYYVNLMCHLWSYLRKRQGEPSARGKAAPPAA